MTASERLRLQRELAAGKNKAKLVSRNKVPLPTGFPAFIKETSEMIHGGSYVALREKFAQYVKQKKLNIPDQVAYLDLAICEGIRRTKGSYAGYCAAPIQGTPNYQLIGSLQSDPRGPKDLRRGMNGRDAFMWKSLHIAALNGQMNQSFLDEFTRAVGCGTCKSGFKTIIRQIPPNFANAETQFESTVKWHNAVNRKISPPKPEISLEEAKQLWS